MPDSRQSYRNNKSLLDDGVMISYPAREIRYLKYDDFDKWEQSTNRIIGHQYFAKFNSQCFEQYPDTTRNRYLANVRLGSFALLVAQSHVIVRLVIPVVCRSLPQLHRLSIVPRFR